MHPKNLSNVAKDALDVLIVNNGSTPLGRVLQRLLKHLIRYQVHYANLIIVSVSNLNNDQENIYEVLLSLQ